MKKIPKVSDFSEAKKTDDQILAEMRLLKKSQKLSPMQQKALDIFISGTDSPSNNMVSCLISAGYHAPKEALEYLGKLILAVYEANTPTAEIFRDLGMGEVEVILGLKKIFKTSTNLTAVLQAAKIAATALDFSPSAEEDNQGASIEIVRTDFSNDNNNLRHDRVSQKKDKQILSIVV